MGKRAAELFLLLMILMLLTILNVYSVSNGTGLAETAERQSTYELTVARSRGTIYDCNKIPLVGTDKDYIAAIAPTVESTAALNKVLSKEKMTQLYSTLSKGKPFSLKVSSDFPAADGINVFTIDKRYTENQLAPNVIGYLDGSGNGAMGIEKAFNAQLKQNQGAISLLYKVDAVNRILPGEDITIDNTYNRKNSGVVLTIDSRIQKIAEAAAKQYLKTGAVVVTEVPSGQIRALVSVPTFSPNDITTALNDKDSPFLNRAMSAYNVGSVFKLVSAAAALESGISPNTEYTCRGGITVSGQVFHCFNGESHGKLNMKEAIAQSCNAYFVNLMQKVPHEKFLSMAQSLGFGKPITLAPDFVSDEGNLPTLKSLLVPQALANFSFGQGDLLATPLQISGMINAIAANGNYYQPYLVEGLVDQNGNYTQKTSQQKGKQVMSTHTAALLRSFMQASIDHGTSQKGKPAVGGAGAKTGTAQTGQYVNGKEVVQAWFAGFFPQNNPKYVITVLGDNGENGGGIYSPVFKQIADLLSQQQWGMNP